MPLESLTYPSLLVQSRRRLLLGGVCYWDSMSRICKVGLLRFQPFSLACLSFKPIPQRTFRGRPQVRVPYVRHQQIMGNSSASHCQDGSKPSIESLNQAVKSFRSIVLDLVHLSNASNWSYLQPPKYSLHPLRPCLSTMRVHQGG